MDVVNHVTHLSQQRSSGKYCDVCVCVAEQRFLAHKCVLSANSDQLDSLILDATDEDNASHDIEIEIHGVSPVGFEIVLEYFYTGVLRLEPSTVTHTWMTAVYLGLPDIINRCNSYCQQSVCVTAHAKLPTAPSNTLTTANQQHTALVPGNNTKAQPQSNGDLVQAQLTTNTVLSTATNQPKVNSMVKFKEEATRQSIVDAAAKDIKNQPVEIREKQGESETPESKKAKYATMDENAIAWNPHSQQNAGAAQPAVAVPSSAVSQVVVNFVQGYGGSYQAVDWPGNANQPWTQLQVGKGQIVATGMIPIASQVKSESVQNSPVQILASDQQISNAASEGAAGAGSSSPVSYTTLSLVSQDGQPVEARNDGDSVSADAATPVLATPAAAEGTTNMQISIPAVGTPNPRTQATVRAQELNLDNIHFTQINNDNGEPRFAAAQSVATTSNFVHPIMINNIQIANADGTKGDTMLMQNQVEQLRIQHQQLQRLRQLETGESVEIAVGVDHTKVAMPPSKRKRKAPTRVAKSEDGSPSIHEVHTHNNVRKTKSLADSVLVTITNDHMEHLYKKYPEIKKNTIRTILDTTGIVESGDVRVQDAVCLIMDRFTVLQEHMNDAYVRKQLTIKVKHSIHCKKWRLKRHKMKQMEMNSGSSPDAHSWNTSKSSVSSFNMDADMSAASSPDVRTTWVADSSMNNSSNSIIVDDGMHS